MKEFKFALWITVYEKLIFQLNSKLFSPALECIIIEGQIERIDSKIENSA